MLTATVGLSISRQWSCWPSDSGSTSALVEQSGERDSPSHFFPWRQQFPRHDTGTGDWGIVSSPSRNIFHHFLSDICCRCCREADGGSELWAKTLEGAVWVSNVRLTMESSWCIFIYLAGMRLSHQTKVHWWLTIFQISVSISIQSRLVVEKQRHWYSHRRYASRSNALFRTGRKYLFAAVQQIRFTWSM